MIVTLFPAAVTAAEIVDSGTCGNNVTWTLDADGLLTISGTGSIKSSAFEDNTTIKKVVVEPGVTSIGNYAFSSCTSLTSVTLPEELTSIGGSAFYSCDSLTSVTLPEGLTSIGDCAFAYCDSLTSITIPDSVTEIEYGAFLYCESLQGIWVDPNNAHYSNDDAGVLFDKEKTTLIQAPGAIAGAYTAPLGLSSIGEDAFSYCTNLTSVTLPEGLSTIGDYAFTSCTSLTSVTLPEGLTTIGDRAFSYCTSLTSVTLPEGLSTIGYDAFYDCDSLTSVTLPEGLSSIGEYAFRSCYDLDFLIFLGSLPSIYSNAFSGSSPTVYYPANDSTWNDDAFQKYGGSPTYKELGDPAELRVTMENSYYLVGQTVEKDHVDVELVYSSGAWSWLPYYQFTMEVDDMTTPGVKALTISSHGVKTTETIRVHRGGTIETDPADWTESKHKYSHNTDETQVLTVPNATQIQITFSGQTFVENGYDYIYLYDGQDDQLKQYTGSEAAGKTVTVQGNTVKIRLVTDGSTNGWGYSLSDVHATWIEHEYDGETGDCTICTGTACDHDWKDATCTTAKTCTKCGSTDTAALGHNFNVITGICALCGEASPFEVEAPQMEYCYTNKQTSVRAKWTKVEGVDGYELYRSTDPDDLNSFQLVKSIFDPNTTTYTNQGLTEGVTYYYRACSFVLLEDGLTRVRSPLSEAKHIPAAVVWNAPYSNSSFRIRLRWAEVGGCHGYQIWRKGTGEEYRVIKTIGDRGNTLTNDQGGTTAYSNVGLTAGETYTYKMRAFYINDDGTKTYGPYSDEVTVAVQPIAPQTTVTSPKAGRAKIQWEAANGATGYQVWMSESPDTGFRIAKSITDGDTTSYTKSSLESGKTYYFKVRAYVEVDGKKTFGAYSETIAIKIK